MNHWIGQIEVSDQTAKYWLVGFIIFVVIRAVIEIRGYDNE